MAAFNCSCLHKMRLLSRSKIPLRIESSIMGMNHRMSTVPSNSWELDQNDVTRAKPFEEIPGPRGLRGLPFIGALFHLKPFTKFNIGTFHLMIAEQLERHGPIVKIQLDKPTIIVSDPKDLETVFRHEGKYPYRPTVDIVDLYFKRTGKKPDLGSIQGEEWQRLRSPINKSFLRQQSVLQFLGSQNTVADDFVNLIGSDAYKTNIASCDPFFWYAAESVAVILFNRRIGFLDQNVDEDAKDYIQATSDVFDLLNKSLFGEVIMYKFFKDKTYRKFEGIKDYMEKQILKYMKEVREKAEAKIKNGTFDPDEPNITLTLLNEDSFSDIDVANTLESLYIAATESTSGTLQACFFILAMNPDKQETLRKEVLGKMGKDGPLTKEVLKDMVYLKATLKECYRYKSPGTNATVRCLPVDVVLGGYKVPAGTQIIGFNNHLQRQGFSDPDSYTPERWLRDDDGNKKDSEHSKWAMLPFGYGPRSCIGKRLAEQELYLALAKTIQKYQIGVEPESLDTEFEYGLFIRPSKPIKFTFTSV